MALSMTSFFVQSSAGTFVCVLVFCLNSASTAPSVVRFGASGTKNPVERARRWPRFPLPRNPPCHSSCRICCGSVRTRSASFSSTPCNARAVSTTTARNCSSRPESRSRLAWLWDVCDVCDVCDVRDVLLSACLVEHVKGLPPLFAYDAYDAFLGTRAVAHHQFLVAQNRGVDRVKVDDLGGVDGSFGSVVVDSVLAHHVVSKMRVDV